MRWQHNVKNSYSMEEINILNLFEKPCKLCWL